MRCRDDRPGDHAPLEAEDTSLYLCAACHDDVIATFPAEIRAHMHRWKADFHRHLILQKALGGSLESLIVGEDTQRRHR